LDKAHLKDKVINCIKYWNFWSSWRVLINIRF
jgi:hypothetical protein